MVHRTAEENTVILLTNDDGIEAPGLHALVDAVAPLGSLFIVAPDKERSAVSHSLTIHDPIRISDAFTDKKGNQFFAVNGTPVDCVKLALNQIVPRKPDLLISGINKGANTGVNILYSGTVAAATEGTIADIPSMAVSRSSLFSDDFSRAAAVAASMASSVLEKFLPHGILLNVNVPLECDPHNGNPIITAQGNRRYIDRYDERKDPRKLSYYWLNADRVELEPDEYTDDWALEHGFVSVTPLQINVTANRFIAELKNWSIKLDQI